MKKIYIVGAGGFGREVAWLIERINTIKPQWELLGFIDDAEKKWGSLEGTYPVLGGCELLEHSDKEIWVVCAIGNAHVRQKVVEKISGYTNVKFATVIDPSVLMSDRVEIGEGSIVCAGTIFTVDIKIGKHVIVNLDCTVGHDAIVEDFVTVYPSVNISGGSTIGRCVELGTGMQIIQGKIIGHDTIVGAGAVVTKDLPCGCTAVGAPAKPIKFWE